MGLLEWAYRVAEQELSEVLPRRWAHSQGVARRSRSLAGLVRKDAELLESAAILHDVGYAPEIARTGFHPLDGARFLRGLGADERVVCLVANHSCALLEADERGLRAELEEFPQEAPHLTDALIFCDMTTTPSGEKTDVRSRVGEIKGRYTPDSPVGRFIVRAEPDIYAAVTRVETQLRETSTDIR